MTSTTPAAPTPPVDEAGIDGLGALDGIIGFHLRLAYGRLYRDFNESAGDLDLTQKQLSALWLIGDHPEIAQADIGRLLQMDRATVMAIINRLQARGFLVRSTSATDRRRQTLHLTEAGRAMLDVARERAIDYENRLRALFSPGEATLLVEMLRRIHG
jgi:DNA-binding MarR family transcriptional regulator